MLGLSKTIITHFLVIGMSNRSGVYLYPALMLKGIKITQISESTTKIT